MLKRQLHAANQVITHPETHTGRVLTIERTVNDKVDLLKITGDSWQHQQEQSRNIFDIGQVKSSVIRVEGNKMIACGYACTTGIRAGAVFKPNTTYTISYDRMGSTSGAAGSVRLLNKEPNIVITSGGGTGHVNKTFTTPEDITNYILYIYGHQDSNLGEYIFENFQIAEGKDELPYEPFQPAMPSPEYPSEINCVGGTLKSTNDTLDGRDKLRKSAITIPELRAIRDDDGNVVAEDILYVDRKQKRAWVEKKVGVIEKKVCVWNDWNEKVKRVVLYVGNMKLPENYFDALGLCNIANVDLVLNNNSVRLVAGYKNIYWYPKIEIFGLSGAETIDEANAALQAYLKETPFICEYVLETQVTEELPYADHLLSTAQYQTNIRFSDINENLQPTIEATVKVLGR